MVINKGMVNKQALALIAVGVLTVFCATYFIKTAFTTQEVWSSKGATELNLTENAPIRYFVIHTSEGDITIRLLQSKTPLLSQNFLDLVKAKFYEGTKFHRTISQKLVEGGDPLSKTSDKSKWGTGDPGYPLPTEPSGKDLSKGVVAAINASQFFILLANSAPQLDGKYPVFAEVIDGMEIVKKISSGPTDSVGVPNIPIEIKSIDIVK